ncbi:MAG TPA: hypothetical protein VHB73_07090, partial [Alphaproteobacteria bacterium]|nr:hypothetical protein [Alphaproteobacteria bacterium]
MHDFFEWAPPAEYKSDFDRARGNASSVILQELHGVNRASYALARLTYEIAGDAIWGARGSLPRNASARDVVTFTAPLAGAWDVFHTAQGPTALPASFLAFGSMIPQLFNTTQAALDAISSASEDNQTVF